MSEFGTELLDSGQQRHWPAFISLGFDKGTKKTRMHLMKFQGPLRVQRPFYPEGKVCHVYLLHPPGGLVSGDDLNIQVDCEQGSEVLLTTPSAGKIYRSDSNDTVQKQRVDIQVENSCCEWLPMETIVFDGAHGELSTHINLYDKAKFIGLDVFCLGRPKSALPFISGSVEQRLSIYHNDKPLMLERQFLASNDALLTAKSGFNGQLVSGTFVVFGLDDPDTAMERLREWLSQESIDTLSVTFRLQVLIVRYLGNCSEQAQGQLRACWMLIRPMLMNRPACVPRIWNT